MCETKVVVPMKIEGLVYERFRNVDRTIEQIKESAIQHRKNRTVFENTEEMNSGKRYDWIIANINDLLNVALINSSS